MKAFLRRHWFLLLLLLGILLVLLWPSTVRWTSNLNPTLSGALAVFISAWGLESRRLLAALVRPWPALCAVLISYLALPAMGWLVAGQLPNDDFRVGLVLMCCVPCTLASAVIWTRMAGGNEAISLLVTMLSNVTSWLATTAWLVLATNVQGVNLAYASNIMSKLFLVLVVPVAVGQALRALPFLAALATKQRTKLGVTARLLILGIMIKAAIDVHDRLAVKAEQITLVALVLVAAACVLVHLAALCLGYWSSAWLGFDRSTRIAVAICGSQKTLPVSLILFNAYFVKDFPLAVVPLIFFHVGQLVVDTYLASRWVRAAEVAKEYITGGTP